MRTQCTMLLMWMLLLLLMTEAVPVRHRGYRKRTYFYDNGDGFYYHINSVVRHSAYMKCVHYERGCHGRAIWREGFGMHQSRPHDVCQRNRYYALEMLCRRAILQRCRRLDMAPFSRIIREERRRFPEAVQQVITYQRLRSSMRNARLSRFPDPPATLAELTEMFQNQNLRAVTVTADGRNNLYAGSITATDGSHCIIFASQRMLDFAREQPILFSDGTFRSVPAQPETAQIFTIIASHDHHVVPVAWILMERMTTSAYTAALRLFRALLGRNIALQLVITDYERAQQLAWNFIFRGVLLQGCLFHMARAFVKYAKRRLHLYQHMRNGPVRTIIRVCIGLALVPLHLVPRAFSIIVRAARNEGLRVYRIVRPFLSYVSRRWVHHNRRRRWMNCCMSENRTNNISESHNRVLNNHIQVAHPNIYLFLMALVDIEADTYINVQGIREGARMFRRRRIRSMIADDRLNNLFNNLIERRIHHQLAPIPPNDDNILRFLLRAAYLFQNVYDNAVEEM